MEAVNYEHFKPQHKLDQKQNKKAMSKFQLSIMMKIGFLLGLAILIVGVMNNLIIFYSFGHIMQISQQQFLDNELNALSSLNFQQSRMVSNQLQMIVTGLHQLNLLNTKQLNGATISTSFSHCYQTNYGTQNYASYLASSLNCICSNTTPTTTCSYSPTPAATDYSSFACNAATIPTSTINNPLYEASFSSPTTRNYYQYLYFAASYPSSDANFSQAQYSQIRVQMQYYFQEFYTVARLIYKSLENFIDFIKITHQTGVEMYYSGGDVSSTYTCTYSTRTNPLFVKTQQYNQMYSKDLQQMVYIDQTATTTNGKIKTAFCLLLQNMIFCQSGVNIPCGMICIQSSNSFALIEKMLKKSIMVNSQEYLLVGSQENSNYQVLNKYNLNSAGAISSFQWLYTTLFNYTSTQTVTSAVSYFSNKFGQYFYPYSSTLTAAQYNEQSQGMGSFQQPDGDMSSFAWSYIKVNQDFEDSSNSKILMTLMSQFDEQSSLSDFSSCFDKESKLNNSWIYVGVVTGLSLIACYIFLNYFSSAIANPIIELTNKVQQIKSGNLDINLLLDFKCSFWEVNQLFEELEQVNLLIKYSTDKFYQDKSDALNLVNLTNAICIYQNLKNSKILGILYNNLGNVHARNSRYQEAVGCFRKACKFAEKDLRNLIKFDYAEVFYKSKRCQGWKNFLQYKEPASPLGWLDQSEMVIEINNRKEVRVNQKIKKKLEEVFCNRLFSLANVLLLIGEKEEKENIKLIYLEEVIDLLNLVESIDKNSDKTKSRSIKIYLKLVFAYGNRAKITGIDVHWFMCIRTLEEAMKKFNYYESIHNLFRAEILKKKIERQSIDEAMSVRKSAIASNFQSTRHQTYSNSYRVNLVTDESMSQTYSRRNNPMAIEMHQFHSSTVQNHSSFKQKPKLPEIITKYQRQLNEEEIDLDVLVDEPPEILKSELEMTSGQFYNDFGQYIKALDHSTRAIEVGKYFNPDIRREALKVIQSIFEKQVQTKQKRIQNEPKDSQEFITQDKIIQDFQKSLKVIKQMLQDCAIKGKKDLVFLVDVSETINRNKIKAIQDFISLRENYVQEDDRLALISFNHNIDVWFELQVRGKNDRFIEKFLNNLKELKRCYGDKALYNAIYEGIKLFQKAEPTSNSRWLVTITDDVDNYSRIDEEQLKPLFFENNVKLIIIGLNLKNNAKEVYQKLCKSTGGTFIENSHSTDLSVAFQSITNMQFGTDQQANYVDEKFD